MNVTLPKHKIALGATGGLAVAASVLLFPAAPAAADTTLSAEAKNLDCAQVECVALTFDDGPGPHTDEVLDALDDHDAKATFYVLGSKVGDFTDTVERMADEGHEVGNHTWDHDDLATLSGDAIRDDLARTDKAIEDVTGETPTTMRPPYGSLNDTAREAIDKPIVLWDVDTLDWQSRDSDAVTDVTLQETDKGSVVLFHDIHESTVDAVPDILDGLAEDGYRFVTVSELAGEDMEPGTAITDAR
ncbi:polysaccharide deacetylase family protein [Nocardiopsis sp. N85]|uniref:polysaccharide deacetylase family protein n=1 Tax=Nocardiopsis sp. N85 TaxID=3029400 RepID=UPI00237FCE57|nr:polysaccharide deacetylase family protein [Nocardiopsis sp. N85]MDE3722841.1 polysaccharide deacetylase family protein [Nocardiopsis sp. N85]